MKITLLQLGDYVTNCYLLLDEDTKKCAIIDPADDGVRIQRELETMGAKPEVILLTHGHYDHILGVAYLQQCWPELPVYCHGLDCPKELTELDMGVVYPTVSSFQNLKHYRETEKIPVGNILVQVIHTPGHTPGSVSLLAEDGLFTGDTLFRGDIGRTDFAGGDSAAIMQSLKKLAELPGNYQVFPGHDGTSTLDQERRTNPYLKRFVSV